ncbi:2259_t:CDS:2 [Acaulospora morrowiae]|uniref:2259_t:CDS:1 n=1 Tax=Acaulospora morrowiae TaxID=94023 RepID=A0A9N9FWY3_9GLOM|nr:2259_t:CDS:2 [Acaulospora morrowiae]
MVPSLLQNVDAFSEQDNTVIVQIPLNQVCSQIDDQPQASSDTSLRAPHSSKVSSPLKLSYIPEPISELEEDIQLSNTENIVVNDNDAEKEVLESPKEKSSSSEENFLKYGSIELMTNEGQQEDLFDPINHLKELLQDQASEQDNVLEVQSHSFDTSSDIPSITSTDAEWQTSNASEVSLPHSDAINLTLRKRRVPPVALISADIRQVRSCVQRTNAYAAKFELLSQEDTGLHLWLNLNKEKEPPLPVKNYKKGNGTLPTLASTAANKIYSSPNIAANASSQPVLPISQTLNSSADSDTLDSSASLSSSKSSKSSVSLRTSFDMSSLRSRQSSPPISPKFKASNFATLANLSRHGSSNKSNRTPINMPPPMMNDPANNSPMNSLRSKSSRQRRFSFQSVSSRFSFGSNSPSSISNSIEENNDASLSGLVVDEVALNKLCDVLPYEDREVLAKYLREAGGNDELMAVSLYMRDLKNGDIS